MTLYVPLVLGPIQREATREEGVCVHVGGSTFLPVRLHEVVPTGKKGNGRQHTRMAAINEDRKSSNVFDFDNL